jgi:hypothetical protein
VFVPKPSLASGVCVGVYTASFVFREETSVKACCNVCAGPWDEGGSWSGRAWVVVGDDPYRYWGVDTTEEEAEALRLVKRVQVVTHPIVLGGFGLCKET